MSRLSLSRKTTPQYQVAQWKVAQWKDYSTVPGIPQYQFARTKFENIYMTVFAMYANF